MINKDFDWKIALEQLFAATVNQQTLEEASELMVSVSANDSSYHEECLFIFDAAISSVESGDGAVIACINRSGYQVADLGEALQLLLDFRSIYIEDFSRVSK